MLTPTNPKENKEEKSIKMSENDWNKGEVKRTRKQLKIITRIKDDRLNCCLFGAVSHWLASPHSPR